MKERRVETPRDYYSHPEVTKAIVRHLGNKDNLSDDISLLEGEHVLKGIACEYLAVSNLDIKSWKGIPVRSIKPAELPGELRKNALSEIFRSFWSKDVPHKGDLPIAERGPLYQLIAWDVEYYNHTYPGWPFIDQQGVFDKLEPSYRVLEGNLNKFGISHMTVMTGRGYHYLTHIPSESPIMEDLIEIGNGIEEPVSGMHRHIPDFSKRDRQIPPRSELAFKGANYLMQYLFSQSINEARETSQLPVEISDRGNEGISFDSTAFVRHAGTGKTGVLGSLYLKPLVKDEYHVENTRVLTRVARDVDGKEIDDVSRLIQVRQNYRLSVDNLKNSGGSIPDGSEGIGRMINEYKKSELRQLHLALDGNPGDHTDVWDSTYRKDDYAWIKNIDSGLYETLLNANPKLLQPDDLNYFINTIYNSFGGELQSAGHVSALLRSIYEDPRFHWGKLFSRHESATRHANGWTAVILGQRFEKR